MTEATFRFNFGAITPEHFLEAYWQTEPYLFRQALPGVEHLLTPEQLSELSRNDEVESRLISQADSGWQLKDGPIDHLDEHLAQPRQALLVQSVDLWHPGVSKLKHQFSFLPSWRVDDVMVSYATQLGGVGPHFDFYDVFLIQGVGQRTWELGDLCDETASLVPGAPLKILSDFEAKTCYTLEAGDVLYLPPRIAHCGTAIDHAMTFSIGFRSPTLAELFDDLATDLWSLPTSAHYRDPPLKGDADPLDIPESVIDDLQTLLHSVVDDRSRLADWFARYMTTPRYPELDTLVPEHRVARYQGTSYVNGFREDEA